MRGAAQSRWVKVALRKNPRVKSCVAVPATAKQPSPTGGGANQRSRVNLALDGG